MMRRVKELAKETARELGRRWHGARDGTFYRCLAWSWRRARYLHRRLLHRQPVFQIVLDAPPRLSGFGAITGWAMSRGGRVTWIEVWVDGQLMAAGPPTARREDVARSFPYYRWQGWTGFHFAPPPESLRDGLHAFRIRACDARGRTAELHATVEVNDYRFADTADLPAHLQGSNREYQLWLRHHEPKRPPSRDRKGAAPPSPFGHEPLISIVIPVYRPKLEHLREAIGSVRAQWYGRWELCLCDDGSQQPELTRLLQESSAADPRIRWTAHSHNRGIAAATNTAIGLGTGDYVALMDHDDRLAPNALHEVVRALQASPADLIYTDEDRLDGWGCRVLPFFKPDWSPDLFQSMMYLAHLCVYRRAFLEQIGPLRSEFDGAQDWDLALRATGRTERIVHIPQVLYHWRLGGNSAGSAFNRLCQARGRRAIEESLRRQGATALVADGISPCTFHVRYLHSDRPLVSLLIPTRDNHRLLKRCLQSIRRRTEYKNYEMLIIDNGSRDPRTLRFLRGCGERVLRLDIPFHHSRLNNLAARHARGALLLLLNDDTEVITPGWLGAMVEQAQRPEVGAVGGWLLHPDGRIQHAGIILGLGPVATPLHTGITRDGLDRGTVRLIRNVSAVTGACLMIRKDLYLEMGGLDEDELPTSFNDVDLCLRLRKAGYRITYTPLAQLYHHESASRLIADEARFIEVMHERWGEELQRDPFWNPNLPTGPVLHPGFAFQWQSADSESGSCREPRRNLRYV